MWRLPKFYHILYSQLLLPLFIFSYRKTKIFLNHIVLYYPHRSHCNIFFSFNYIFPLKSSILSRSLSLLHRWTKLSTAHTLVIFCNAGWGWFFIFWVSIWIFTEYFYCGPLILATYSFILAMHIDKDDLYECNTVPTMIRAELFGFQRSCNFQSRDARKEL